MHESILNISLLHEDVMRRVESLSSCNPPIDAGHHVEYNQDPSLVHLRIPETSHNLQFEAWLGEQSYHRKCKHCSNRATAQLLLCPKQYIFLMHVRDAEHLFRTSTIPFNAAILIGVLQGMASNDVKRTIRDFPLAEHNPSRLGVLPPGCL